MRKKKSPTFFYLPRKIDLFKIQSTVVNHKIKKLKLWIKKKKLTQQTYQNCCNKSFDTRFLFEFHTLRKTRKIEVQGT